MNSEVRQIGKDLLASLKELGIKIEDASLLLGVSHMTIYRWGSGWNTYPKKNKAKHYEKVSVLLDIINKREGVGMSNLNSLEFLEQVLPKSARGKEYFIVDIEPKYKVKQRKNGRAKIVHHTSNTIKGIIEKASLIDKNGSNAYFALANFDTTNEEYGRIKEKSNGQRGRQAKFTSQIKCLFLDIDVGKDKNAYEDDGTAVQEIGRVCSTTTLPLPIINRSGNGLHAYWVFDEAVDVPIWSELALDFKTLVEKHGLIIDPQIPTDPARILRVLNTSNYNDGTKKEVKNIYGKHTPKPFDYYRKLIPVANKPKPSPNVKLKRPKNAPLMDQATKNIFENSASRFSEIHEKSIKGEGCNQKV